jgi:outer membrane protein
MLRGTKKFLLTGVAAAIILPCAAFAETAGGVAVVDTRYIMDNSKAGKSVAEQIESKRKTYQNELKEKEASLSNEKKKIVAEQGKGDKAALDAKLADFQKKLQDANKLLNSRQAQLEAASLNGIKQIRDKTVDIVKRIASDKGYSAVINKSAILYNADDTDITKEVMDRLNSDLPSVSIKAE